MDFTSFLFALFLPSVFVIHWLVASRTAQAQNWFLVAASYLFYGMWDIRCLLIIVLMTILSYYAGIVIYAQNEDSARRRWFTLAVIGALLPLALFKYFGFFIENLIGLASLFGISLHAIALSLVLPVGISFYTFQIVSYLADIYRDKIGPASNLVSFAAFVCFFPQLVAGPIERASRLLPQFAKQRTFSYTDSVEGMRQILWGLFTKMVIADNCATFANQILDQPGDYGGSTVLLGAVFFTIQIYGDFSGYSNIAIGTARLFGITLSRNFATPYFSRDIAEFWRRWHISLTTWFRDYIYIPLGGSRGSRWLKIRNTLVVFLVSGLWHGANWTFVTWGLINALFFMPLLISGRNREHLEIVAANRLLPSLKESLQMGVTFGLTVFAWVFFRAQTLSQAVAILTRVFSRSLVQIPQYGHRNSSLLVLVLALLFFSVEWYGRHEHYALAGLGQEWPRPLRWTAYSCLVFAIGMFSPTVQTPFIYFQF